MTKTREIHRKADAGLSNRDMPYEAFRETMRCHLRLVGLRVRGEAPPCTRPIPDTEEVVTMGYQDGIGLADAEPVRGTIWQPPIIST
jgi:hypothetical protein